MFLHLPTLFFFWALSHAQHTYNITNAFQPGNFQKYHCLDTAKVNTWLPKCLHKCHIKANLNDGCAYDDMACHCVNYAVYTDIIEPCAFPRALGGNGTCTLSDLVFARPIISSMCNFYNATLYAAYNNCPQELSKNKTFGLVALGDTLVSGVRVWNGTEVVWNVTHWRGNGTHGGSCKGAGWANGTHWNETKSGF